MISWPSSCTWRDGWGTYCITRKGAVKWLKRAAYCLRQVISVRDRGGCVTAGAQIHAGFACGASWQGYGLVELESGIRASVHCREPPRESLHCTPAT